MAKETKRVTTKVRREVTIEANEIEDILAEKFGLGKDADFDWDTQSGCVFRVTITSSKETEEDA
jgi:hypothetical protein